MKIHASKISCLLSFTAEIEVTWKQNDKDGIDNNVAEKEKLKKTRKVSEIKENAK